MTKKCPVCGSDKMYAGDSWVVCECGYSEWCGPHKRYPLDTHSVPPMSGTCGKCGAPYSIDQAGNPRPICVCWNLPKIATSTNTSGS